MVLGFILYMHCLCPALWRTCLLPPPAHGGATNTLFYLAARGSYLFMSLGGRLWLVPSKTFLESTQPETDPACDRSLHSLRPPSLHSGSGPSTLFWQAWCARCALCPERSLTADSPLPQRPACFCFLWSPGHLCACPIGSSCCVLCCLAYAQISFHSLV